MTNKIKFPIQLSFVKETSPWYLRPIFGRDAWFIDLPEYINKGLGTKLNLQMVRGADDLLDHIGQGKERVTITVHNKPTKKNQMELIMYKHDSSGGTYRTNIAEVPDVWLCNVTKYVFGGKHPLKIYIDAN